MTDTSTQTTATSETTPLPKAPRKTTPKAAPVATPAQTAGKTKTQAKPKATKAPKAEAKPSKPAKPKLVRDSFTFPEPEYQTLVALKKRLLAAGTEAKKGELVRAGLALLAALDNAALAAAVGRVEKLKTGRPAK